VYSLTRTLTQQGHIERVELLGDSFGFRPARVSAGAGTEDAGGDFAARSHTNARSTGRQIGRRNHRRSRRRERSCEQ
jgi:hypothetical protein